jgi:transcriptional regulator with XRE-family HTH domain
LGGKIRLAREARGWSQADLARELQLYGWDEERTVITKIELRRRCVTDIELIAIAEVLRISLDKLAHGRPPIKALLAQAH